jgi:F0F1-type ATP synthase membrane subunit b/b'
VRIIKYIIKLIKGVFMKYLKLASLALITFLSVNAFGQASSAAHVEIEHKLDTIIKMLEEQKQAHEQIMMQHQEAKQAHKMLIEQHKEGKEAHKMLMGGHRAAEANK